MTGTPRPTGPVQPGPRRTTSRERFASLPAPIPMADLIESVDVQDVADPEGGHDTDAEFVIRHAG